MRGLAKGTKGYEKTKKAMQEKFVFLNVYCTSVADEHKPRGPEGPYQFNDKSVPVSVIKRWDGHSFHQELGFTSDPQRNLARVAGWIEKALKENGPVLPPKKLRPLMKVYEKGLGYLAKKRPGYAWKEFAKVEKLGADKKRFPQGPPAVAADATARKAEIKDELEKALAAAEDLRDENPGKAKAAFARLMRSHGTAKELKTLIIAARDA